MRKGQRSLWEEQKVRRRDGAPYDASSWNVSHVVEEEEIPRDVTDEENSERTNLPVCKEAGRKCADNDGGKRTGDATGC
jgi:hypothetical protein